MTEEQRQQLDGIVNDLISKGVQDDHIQAVVDGYKTKFDGGSGGGRSSDNLKKFGNAVASKVQGAANTVGRVTKGLQAGAMDPFMKLLSPLMDSQTQRSVDSANAVDKNLPGYGIGRMGGDIAATLPLVAGGGELAGAAAGAMKAGPVISSALSGLGMGAGSAATHAAMDANMGKGVQPGNAMMEMLGSAGLGAAGTAIGGAMKSAAPTLLEMLAPGTKAMQESKNAPSSEGYKTVLEKGLIPIVGGFKKAADRVGQYLTKQDAARKGFLDASGTRFNVNGALAQAQQDITGDIAAGAKQGVTPSDAGATEKWFQDISDAASQMPSYKNGWIDASDAIKLKTGIGQNAKFVQGESQEGRKLASEKYAKATNQQINNRVSGTPGEDVFQMLQGNLRQAAPIQEALQQKSYGGAIPWWEGAADLAGAGAVGAGMMTGNAGAAIAGSAPLIYSMMKRTPGSAAALYQGGKSLLKPSMLRNAGAQAGRSLVEGD